MILKLLVLLGATIALTEGTYKPKVPKTVCGKGWMQFRGFCYYFSTKAETRNQAAVKCKSYGSYLVKIGSNKENVYLRGIINRNIRYKPYSFWIFPMCLKSKGKYYGKCRWNYGRLAFNPWKPGKEPFVGCAVLNCEKYWGIKNCGAKLPYICKRLPKRPRLVIDEAFPGDSSSESSSSENGGNSGSGSRSSGGKKKKKKNGGGSSSSSNGGKYKKKGGGSSSSSGGRKKNYSEGSSRYNKKKNRKSEGGSSSSSSDEKKKKKKLY